MAYWLFSHTYTTGSFQIAAMLVVSCRMPCSSAPSPKKQMATAPVFCSLAVSAAPVARPMPPPTMPLAPSMCLSMSAMCMLPPLPPE